MHPSVRPATQLDVVKVGMNLKPDDHAELAALEIETSPQRMEMAYRLSRKVYAWGPEDGPLAVFGVTPDPVNPVGYLWSLSTPDILSDWREVHRATPAILDELGQGFNLLANIKDARHRHHIRWLRSLGFIFISTVRLGPEGLPFHEFVRIQK